MRQKHLICPNTDCGKTFTKPIVLADNLSLPRRTYYACPHCKSKLEIVVENGKLMKIVSVKKPGKVFMSPSSKEETKKYCAHYFGYLKTLPKNHSIPDECLTCPKMIQCFVRRT